MQSVPFIFDCWILWLMISVAAPFFALKMMVKFFYIFILSENLWIWKTLFRFCKICCSADKFSAPLSRPAELRRGHLALCSNESQSTLHICQNHEQLVALSSLGSALPTESCPDGYFTTTRKSDLEVTQHSSSKPNSMWIAAHFTLLLVTMQGRERLFVCSTNLSDGGPSITHTVPRLPLNYSCN